MTDLENQGRRPSIVEQHARSYHQSLRLFVEELPIIAATFPLRQKLLLSLTEETKIIPFTLSAIPDLNIRSAYLTEPSFSGVDRNGSSYWRALVVVTIPHIDHRHQFTPYERLSHITEYISFFAHNQLQLRLSEFSYKYDQPKGAEPDEMHYTLNLIFNPLAEAQKNSSPWRKLIMV